MKYKKRTGFTLVEILIVTAIIALLFTLTIYATTSSRLKSRDAKRVSNVTQIVTALEAYYDSNKSYPIIITAGMPISSGNKIYLKSVPINPLPRTDGGCIDQDYQYTTTTTGYKLTFCLGSNTGRFTKGVVLCKNGNCGVSDTNCGPGVTVTDRDGNVYPTVEVAVQNGSQCWLGKNLYTKSRLLSGTPACINTGGGATYPTCAVTTGANFTEVGYDGSRRDCLRHDGTTGPPDFARGHEANCAVNGALYTWAAAMNLPDTCNDSACTTSITLPYHQGICPDGWHVPNDNEWSVLEISYTDSPNPCSPTREYPTGAQCQNARTRLAVGGVSGYDGQYVGGRDYYGTNYLHFGYGVDYWTTGDPDFISAHCSGSSGHSCAIARIINNGDTGVTRWDRLKIYGFSLRCIKDPS